MDQSKVLQKITLLLSLSKSPNENEANNALELIESLKSKYNITNEEIEQLTKEAPKYSTQENLLFTSNIILSWKNRLAFLVASKYYCYVVEEQNTASTGEVSFDYYLFGDEVDIEFVKNLFNIILKEIEQIVKVNCFNKDEVYVHSYQEGLVEGIKEKLEEFEVPGIVRKTTNIQEIKENQMVETNKEKTFKEKPIKETTKIKSGELIKDIHAYWKGVEDGFYLKIDREDIELLTP